MTLVANTTLVTVHQQILGNVAEFLSAAGVSCMGTSQLASALAISLPGYREEEVALFPCVFICNDLHAMIGSEQHLYVGTASRGGESAAEILKNCGSLARGGWYIFVERGEKDVRYGVFRVNSVGSASDPMAIFDIADFEATPVCFIRSIAPRVVEMGDHRGRKLHLDFSSRQLSYVSLAEAVGVVSDIIVGGRTGTDKDVALQFLRGTLMRALQSAHGAIIAVTYADRQPPKLTGNWLAEAINVVDEVVALYSAPDRVAFGRVQGLESLLEGMIASDGITVFSDHGVLRGFRLFTELPGSEAKAAGGARSRAFEALVGEIGRSLAAVLKVSQDGAVELEREGK